VESVSKDGIRDLIGNVAEWCLPGTSHVLQPDELYGVLRGGATWHAPGVADSSFRDEVNLSVRDNQTGIRLVRRISPVELGGPVAGNRPIRARRLGRSIERPTKPFRQEGIPDINIDKWCLRVHGDALPNPREFSIKELRNDFAATPPVKGLFVCVCRWAEVNVFRGVLLRHVLESCGYREKKNRRALYVRQISVKGPKGVYETTVPLAEALEHGAILAYKMDEAELTPELGWPLRFIDLHRYGYKGVKCLAELEITYEYGKGWWERRCQYDLDGTVLPGTVTVVGKDALRLDIKERGKVAHYDALTGDDE